MPSGNIFELHLIFQQEGAPPHCLKPMHEMTWTKYIRIGGMAIVVQPNGQLIRQIFPRLSLLERLKNHIFTLPN
jgi:hypothetical protein